MNLAHKSSGKRKSEPLELVHSDVCGHFPTISLGGASYFAMFIDVAPSNVWVFPIHNKSDVFHVFQPFLSQVENQCGSKLIYLRTNNGGEYMSKAFQGFCDICGIKRELISPYNPPQNGVPKRMNRTIKEKVCSMLSNAGLPHGFWAEAVKTALHLINRLPSKVLDEKIPKELWSGKPPSAYVHVPKVCMVSLTPIQDNVIFWVSDFDEMGYRLWDPKAKNIVRNHDVVFNENKMHKSRR